MLNLRKSENNGWSSPADEGAVPSLNRPGPNCQGVGQLTNGLLFVSDLGRPFFLSELGVTLAPGGFKLKLLRMTTTIGLCQFWSRLVYLSCEKIAPATHSDEMRLQYTATPHR